MAEKKAAAKVDGVFVDTRQVYCSGDSCPTFADGIIIRFDSTHITDEWGIHVAPGIVVLLDNAGVHLGEQPSETTGDAPVDGSG